MDHVLDNPIWNALTSNNAHLGEGTETARYFHAEVSPFVALKNDTDVELEELYQILPSGRLSLYMSARRRDLSAAWKVLATIGGYQMVHQGAAPPTSTSISLTDLTGEHIPQMLSLTKLTKPGPFDVRTIEFGHYRGVIDNGQLVAMAGQRMHAHDHMEISAVCTHPDHLGKGYARQLLTDQIHRIKSDGGTPYLHVRDDNDRAVKVYQSLGFVIRMPVTFYFIKKAVK